jgi:hypothetical protein
VSTKLCDIAGKQHIVFNSQSTIQVGGRWNRGKSRIDKSYLGIISGLVVNGVRVLELAAAKDNGVTVKGDVQMLPIGSLVDRAAPLQRMQQVSSRASARGGTSPPRKYRNEDFSDAGVRLPGRRRRPHILRGWKRLRRRRRGRRVHAHLRKCFR